MIRVAFILFILINCAAVTAQETIKHYLSGTGSDDTVQWEFFCTSGMNAGKWTNIAVPSCWELQGFGKYDYGFAKDSVRGKEQGLYRHRFHAPQSWKGQKINLVFEGVMTDAEVKINGKLAGPVHQGAFYAFKFDVSSLLNYGKENLLEVIVSKHSANASVNEAERKADYWIFGGIFRPVWLEVLPPMHISKIAIDAGADGSFNAMVQTSLHFDRLRLDVLDDKGRPIAASRTYAATGNALIENKFKEIKAWSPEVPNRYTAVISLHRGGKPVHTIRQKFGFRTIELKQRDGIYLNGVKVKMKGVNRHAFRPETGRTTSKKISIEDVLLMKEMNMNAVRMSHYPPDDHFLDACDSLGLMVMNELAGWHGHYDTPTGSVLLREMIDHDVNHPSIIFWANGNEGGHNRELDSLFYAYDIQRRPLVHPWELYNGIETQHYREYNYGIGNYVQGNEIIMPTEFLHGQFDGGHGAGLEDYWEQMWHEPLSAGGYLWDLADNAVVRKDRNDSLDTDKHRAADGIVGPHHEKEGSFYAIKEIWSPVRFKRRLITPGFDGSFPIENRYHFTNISQCRFSWQLKKLTGANQTVIAGNATSPDIVPGGTGMLSLSLPPDWSAYDVLYVTARDAYQRELFTWSFPITSPAMMQQRLIASEAGSKPVMEISDSVYRVTTKDVEVQFNRNNGLLLGVRNKRGTIPFNQGPVVQQGVSNFGQLSHRYEDSVLVLSSSFDRKEHYNTIEWRIAPSGWIGLEVKYFPAAYFTDFAGLNFSFPEAEIRSVNYTGDGPYRVWKNRLKGNRFGRWSKSCNNTETGESPWQYPEFKGYHSRFYNGEFVTRDNRFVVSTENENLYLRLFTPAWKTDQWHNYEPIFPSGDISFMQGISSIGTKTQRNETTGPMGLKNIFYDYEKAPERALQIRLNFNFCSE